MDLRPEHPPKGCTTETDQCTHVNRDGSRCGLYADMHRPPRVRKQDRRGRRQRLSENAKAKHATWTANVRAFKEAERAARPKRKKSRGMGAQTECQCGTMYRNHSTEWPHAREECAGFIPKMRKMEGVVSCVACHVSFYTMRDLEQHIDVSDHPERWGPCRAWKRSLACCVNCRRQFFVRKTLNKHIKAADCKTYERRDADETEEKEEA